jgi:uncharacterized repeat protein (TIGR01451 family)
MPGASEAFAAQTPASCPSAVSLVNGGFEMPSLPPGGLFIGDQSGVPGWSTTAPDGEIEIWNSTNPSPGSGVQFAELNANYASTLYQDVATTPGQVLKWQLQHRGRSGTDVMRVLLGAPSTLVQQGGDISDGNTAWGSYSGIYTVPAGQTVTRFAFESVSSTGGPSYGNFLDSISLGNAACVIATKSVTNVTRPGSDPVVGDVLEYAVQVSNAGGVPATDAVVTDALPAGVTFVPGSIVAPTGAVSDAAADDVGEYDAGTVRVRVGDGADASNGGSIPGGESRTITFRATVDPGTVGLTLVNEASVAFVDSLSGTPSTSVSNGSSAPVLPTDDLQVAQILDTPIVNGGTVEYTITVRNNGPQTSTDTVLTSTLPLPGMTVNDGDCTIVLSDLSCQFGDLADAGSRVIQVAGTIPVTAAGGTTYQLDSSVGGSVYDSDPTNNNATTPGTLADVAALGLDMTITTTTPGAPAGAARRGDLLLASYVVTNTGNVDLTTLAVTDPTFGPVTCTPTSLAPGDTADCTADSLYSVTAQDVVNGSVASAATAQADPAAGGAAAAVDTDAASIATVASATIALTGSSPGAALLAAGLLLMLGLVATAVTRAGRGRVRLRRMFIK